MPKARRARQASIQSLISPQLEAVVHRVLNHPCHTGRYMMVVAVDDVNATRKMLIRYIASSREKLQGLVEEVTFDSKNHQVIFSKGCLEGDDNWKEVRVLRLCGKENK